MRKCVIWNVRLDRKYDYQTRILTNTEDIAEAMPYALKYAKQCEKNNSDGIMLKVTTLECEGEIRVPDGLLNLTGQGQ